MNLNNKREEIRRINYPTAGLVIITILASVGILCIFMSGIFNVRNDQMLHDSISKYGLFIFMGLFFFIIFLCVWISFFRDIILKPKKEVLFLYKNNKNSSVFKNKKGKEFYHDKSIPNEKHYYEVLKTNNYIYEVIGEVEGTYNTWIFKKKESYWLNFYSPIGNFKGIFLLPIFYIILLPLLLSFIMSKGYQRIYGLLLSALPLYTVVYDLIHKIRPNKEKNNAINEETLSKSYEILKNIISIVGAIIFCIIIICIMFFTLLDFISKLILAPFLCCGLCAIGSLIAKVLKNYKLENIFSKGYIIIFLIYWFGFLTYFTVEVIKQGQSYLFALFLIPFWATGIYIIYKYFIKKI